MDKINLGAAIPAYPMPVSLVGTHVNGKPNFMTVAWFSMVSYKPPRIAIALGKGHYTNPGIKEHKSFSVCLPSEDMNETPHSFTPEHHLLATWGTGGHGLEHW